MSNTKRPPTPDPVKPLDPEIDLPVGKAVALMQVPRMGWVVLEIKTQGSKVIESTVVYGPANRGEAIEAVKLRTVRYTLVNP